MLKKQNQKGFTIIEVLIVLAIAAVILMVVFLAVPALQRNNRNAQYKNAASAIAAAVNEYSTNSNGAMPAFAEINGTSGEIFLGATPPGASYGKTQAGYTVVLSAENPTETGVFNLATNNKCNGTVAAAAKRSVAVLYITETSNGNSPQCVEG